MNQDASTEVRANTSAFATWRWLALAAVVVERQSAFVIAGPDRVPGRLTQELQMFAALAHRRNRTSDSRGLRPELKMFLPL